MDIAASNEISLLVIKFRVGGSLRFLSHAETIRVFERACVRAGIGVRYSEGFNPRPKLSLPLPRPVGVESDDELLCLKVHKSTRDANDSCIYNSCSFVKAELSPELPKGCELLSVNVAKANTSFQPCSATYVLTVRKEYLGGKLKSTIKDLLACEKLNIQRRIDKKRVKVKNLDVRDFLKSIKLDGEIIIVECRISSAGSIRIEEILTLLGLDENKLTAPIRRTSVQWQEV